MFIHCANEPSFNVVLLLFSMALCHCVHGFWGCHTASPRWQHTVQSFHCI